MARLALLALVVVTTWGCATYTDHLIKATGAASTGNYEAAISEMNGAIGVASSDQLPDQWSGDTPLIVLERGSLQQAVTRFKGSSRDFSGAEQQLELLDLKTDPVGTLGSYLFSDSVKTYLTPPTERLSLNAINMLNYLAIGDLDGAAVEARRFQVMREFLSSKDIKADQPAALGTYLAGFVFEHRGEGDRALGAVRLASLEGPIKRLARTNPYRGNHLAEVLKSGGSPAAANASQGELLVVVSVGRVPHREPRRIAVGAAVGLAGTAISGNADFLKYGATKVVVYPELVSTPSSIGSVAVQIDQSQAPVEELTNLGAAIRKEYDEMRPQIVAAALTRMAARAGAAEGVRAAGRQESSLLGDILSILFESTMVALDKPDTRSWTMLPDRVLVTRVPVSEGAHNVTVSFGQGGRGAIPVNIPNGGFAVVVVTEPR